MLNNHQYKDAQKVLYANLRKAISEATTDAEILAAYRTFGSQDVQAFRDWDGGDPTEDDIE